MDKLEYQKYLQGEHWKSVRERFKGRKCLGCEADKDITLHHTNYARLGAELDTDLRPLCWPCHQEVHRLIDVGNKKLSHTDIHIAKIRKERGLPLIVRERKVALNPKPPEQQRPEPQKQKLSKKQRRKLRNEQNKAKAVSIQIEKNHEDQRRAAALSLAMYRKESRNNTKYRPMPKNAIHLLEQAIATSPPKQLANPMLRILKDIRRHRGIH